MSSSDEDNDRLDNDRLLGDLSIIEKDYTTEDLFNIKKYEMTTKSNFKSGSIVRIKKLHKKYFILKMFRGDNLHAIDKKFSKVINVYYGKNIELRKKITRGKFIKDNDYNALHVLDKDNSYRGSIIYLKDKKEYGFSWFIIISYIHPIIDCKSYNLSNLRNYMFDEENVMIRNKKPHIYNNQLMLLFYQPQGIGSVKNVQLIDKRSEIILEMLKQRKRVSNVIYKDPLDELWCIGLHILTNMS